MTLDVENKLSAMKEGGALLGKVRNKLAGMVAPGVTLLDIELEAARLLEETGGEVAFTKVQNYYWATCINVNEGVVHGIPTDYRIQDGDVVSIDVGLWFKGFYTDTSTSVIAGKGSEELKRFLNAGKESLQLAIAEAKLGNRVGHISQAIEKRLKQAGYNPIHELTGHGVGSKLHEKPHIPGILSGDISKTPLLQLGQTLAIEVIYAMGKPDIIIAEDGWTIETKDGKIAGLFEETVAITETGPLILTI